MRDETSANDAARQEGSLPFFTRFLEGQGNEQRNAATTKYPSDWDDMTTHKYPSDGDDDLPSEGSVMQAGGAAGQRQTLKYPSDRDEWDPTMNS